LQTHGPLAANFLAVRLLLSVAQGETLMQEIGTKLVAILRDEEGQDLVEYALVMALIALAATAGMTSVASKISTAFTNIGTKLSTYTS
jgi:pilus assembly protein Flp/PilA